MAVGVKVCYVTTKYLVHSLTFAMARVINIFPNTCDTYGGRHTMHEICANGDDGAYPAREVRAC